MDISGTWFPYREYGGNKTILKKDRGNREGTWNCSVGCEALNQLSGCLWGHDCYRSQQLLEFRATSASP